jgi:hypothetical protein
MIYANRRKVHDSTSSQGAVEHTSNHSHRLCPVPVRLGVRPEIAVIELVCSDKA